MLTKFLKAFLLSLFLLAATIKVSALEIMITPTDGTPYIADCDTTLKSGEVKASKTEGDAAKLLYTAYNGDKLCDIKITTENELSVMVGEEDIQNKKISFFTFETSPLEISENAMLFGTQRKDEKLSYALSKINKLFSADELVNYIASLYDPDIGGFYACSSARDNAGFLPDIESTRGALETLRSLGAKNVYTDCPDDIKGKITSWVKSLQSEEDGYFYHPQDNGNASINILERALTSGRYILRDFGASAKCPFPFQRQAQLMSSSTEKFDTKEKVKAYIDSLPWETDSYRAGSDLSLQANNIAVAGFLAYAIECVEAYQNPETGFWGDEISYRTLGATLKVSYLYRGVPKQLPYAEKIIESIYKCFKGDEYIDSAPLIWNGWNLIAIMKEISRNHGGDFPTKANAFLNNNAAEMINITAKNLELFKATKDAGAFSTYQAAIGGVSDNEGIKRGLGIAGEGDINATGGVYLNALGQIYKSLEIPSPVASMLSEEDGVRFFNLLKNAKPIKRHSLYDVAFDFEDDKYTLGEAPMDDLIKNTIDTGASVTVVEDPLSKNGKVLRIETPEDKNYGVQTKFALGWLEDIKKATVSFDIYIPREGVLNNAEVFYGIAFGGMLRFDIYSNSKNSGFYLRYNGSDDGLSPWCRYDEGWHNIKLEYDAVSSECIKIYIDNNLALSTADYSSYPQKPYTKGYNLLNFTFGGYKSSIGYSFIDNIKIFKD